MSDIQFLLEMSFWDKAMDINDITSDTTSHVKQLMYKIFLEFALQQEIEVAIVTPEMYDKLNEKYGQRSMFSQFKFKIHPPIRIPNHLPLEPYLASTINLLIEKCIEKKEGNNFYFVVEDANVKSILEGITKNTGYNIKIINSEEALKILKESYDV